MFWEYVTDMSFVLASVIGGIVAICFVFIKRKRVR
ncbi:EYxxD motif small membrane protein [Bacillus sp. DJP31]